MKHDASHEELYQRYLEELTRRFPSFRLIKKGESTLSRWIDKALRLITLGRQARYSSQFITTLGSRVYVPDDWSQWPAGQRYVIMRHEAVHMAQFQRYTWPGMVFLYLLIPVPVGFALGRAWLEWQGYAETLSATWQLFGREAAYSQELHRHIVGRFTGPDYAWMWLHGKSIEDAIENHLKALEEAPPPPLTPPTPS